MMTAFFSSPITPRSPFSSFDSAAEKMPVRLSRCPQEGTLGSISRDPSCASDVVCIGRKFLSSSDKSIWASRAIDSSSETSPWSIFNFVFVSGEGQLDEFVDGVSSSTSFSFVVCGSSTADF